MVVVVPWTQFRSQFRTTEGSSSLCTSLEFYNVYCNLNNCGKWPLVTPHFETESNSFCVLCWTTTEGRHEEATDVVIPISVSSSLSPTRLQDLCHIKASKMEPKVISKNETWDSVRLTFVDQGGLMVFTQIFDHLKAPPFSSSKVVGN